MRLAGRSRNAATDRPQKTVAVFGFDASESSQIRRIKALLDAGYAVTGFTMRRRNMNARFVPFWDNVHLYTVENENLLKRMVVLLAAALKLLRHAPKIRRADVIIARNVDLLLLAHIGRLFALKPIPVIYECLDVHSIFTEGSAKSAVFRWAERRLLARSSLLVVSSAGFVKNYFEPVQRYQGPVHLMENKLWFSGKRPERRPPAAPRSSAAPGQALAERTDAAGHTPVVLGWVGSLRCPPSFEILTGAAHLMTNAAPVANVAPVANASGAAGTGTCGITDIRLAFFGNVHRHALPDFDERLAAVPGARYHGAYAYPDGLTIYRGLDLVWAQDLWQQGANSDWLLPNRIYEASYFGCLSIALAGTETGRIVAERGLGYVIEEASPQALAALLGTITRDDIAARRQALLARPASDFVATARDVTRMVDAAFQDARRPHPAHDRVPDPSRYARVRQG